ncbi:MAG: DUF4342 domain-containing protein [Vicinamibacterales bacterium]
MTERTYWETINEKGAALLTTLKELLHEGNVRHVVVKQRGRTVAEFPVTVGVVGAVFAPTLAAVGAVVAVLTDCTLEVERTERSEEKPVERRAADQATG